MVVDIDLESLVFQLRNPFRALMAFRFGVNQNLRAVSRWSGRRKYRQRAGNDGSDAGDDAYSYKRASQHHRMLFGLVPHGGPGSTLASRKNCRPAYPGAHG